MDLSQLLVTGSLGLLLAIIFWKFVTRNGPQKSLKLPPGPGGLPILGNMSVLFDHRNTTINDYFYTKCAKKYGDIYKLSFGSSLLYVISNVDYLREAFKNPNLQDRLAAVAYERVFGKRALGVVFSSGEDWRVVRRFALAVFRDLGVGKGVFESNITLEVDRLTAVLDKQLGRHCNDLRNYFYMAICNITCGITFGKQFEYDDQNFKDIMGIMSAFSKSLGPGGMLLSSRVLSSLPFGPSKDLFQTLTKFKQFLKIIIDEQMETMKSDQSKDNFVAAYLMKMQKEKGALGFNLENLFVCSMEMFFAGTETGTATLTFAILLLAAYPECQKKCQEEMDRACGNDSERSPVYAEKSNHHYLQAFVQEVQRFANIVPVIIPHVASCDLQLFGYDVPKGTGIIIDMGSIFMNENIFPNPLTFKPERFLKDGCFQPNPNVIPFSIGTRVCLGEQLARMEMHIFLMHLVKKYNFAPPKDVPLPDVYIGTEGGIRFPLPYTVVITRRHSPK